MQTSLNDTLAATIESVGAKSDRLSTVKYEGVSTIFAQTRHQRPHHVLCQASSLCM